jgi:MscS family membrane protein
MNTYFDEVWLLVPNWKWLSLCAAVILILILRPLVRALFVQIKKRAVSLAHQDTFAAQTLKLPIEKPLSWIILLAVFSAAISALQLPPTVQQFILIFVKVFFAINLIRVFYHSVDALGLMMGKMAAKTENTLDDQLVPFATKTLKVLVVALGVLISLQNFGFNVVGLLAGLGLGGLALALAAQDTAANVFGSVTILLDQPFAVGDWIKVGDTEGVVEEIGFRSTRIRTFYNSLITLPNSTIAKEKVDNLQLRPRRRIRQVLGVRYETTPDEIESFCGQVKAMLKSHPNVDQDVVVAFNNFNSFSLDILMQFHLLEIFDLQSENQLVQKLFLQILEIAKKSNVEFAYPTQTVHLATSNKWQANN